MLIYEFIDEVTEPIYKDAMVKATDENGKVYWIPLDPGNSDYQAYLKRDEPQVEHLTEIVPQEENNE